MLAELTREQSLEQVFIESVTADDVIEASACVSEAAN
jgi:hypothetical protein